MNLGNQGLHSDCSKHDTVVVIYIGVSKLTPSFTYILIMPFYLAFFYASAVAQPQNVAMPIGRPLSISKKLENISSTFKEG
jgi:hypothetical protein